VPRADAPTAVRVIDQRGRRLAVLLCSAPGYGDMVAHAMQGAAQAREMLNGADAEAILTPILEGRLQGLSYAALPHCEPLASRGLRWRIQRGVLRPGLLDWLFRLTVATAVPVPVSAMEARYAEPLSRIIATPQLAARVRADARQAHARLRETAWQPVSVLMHGDLWRGNVLLRPHRGGHWGTLLAPRFAVIDWPGSLQQGYAVFDLVRLSLSFEVRGRAWQAELHRHCALMDYTREDAMGSLLAALGHIAIHLEEFPLSRFVSMAEACHAAFTVG